MNAAEQELLKKWRYLPLDQQREVLDFAEFLVQKVQRQSHSVEQAEQSESLPLPEQKQEPYTPKTPLGKHLWEIRQQAIASGMQLQSIEELEQEIAEQRDRHRNLHEKLH